jgi:hypothetical protein
MTRWRSQNKQRSERSQVSLRALWLLWRDIAPACGRALSGQFRTYAAVSNSGHCLEVAAQTVPGRVLQSTAGDKLVRTGSPR